MSDHAAPHIPTVVVSAISLFVGGPLTVGRELIAALCASNTFRRGELRIIVICLRRDFYPDVADHPNLQWVEKPHARTNWLVRMFYEYLYFDLWSRRRQVDLWISAADVTPNVRAAHRVVYCHNPAAFYRGPHDWIGDLRLEIFRIAYRLFYRINLRRNDYAIVQQQWLRDEFQKRFGRPQETTVVAHPVPARPDGAAPPAKPGAPIRLLYPAFPRSFKNCEVLIDAMRELRDLPVELTLTFKGDENRYARRMRKKAEGIPGVRLAGFLPKQELERLYEEATLLVFPSKLETWGLPLSEFRAYGKPILAADLPYAREVLGGYASSAFFDPDSAPALARLIRQFAATGTLPYVTGPVAAKEPFASNWTELTALLLRLIGAA